MKGIGGLPIKREVDFKLKKEDWSKYEILDGRAVVWVRAVLLKIFEIDVAHLPSGVALPPGGQFITSTQIVVTASFSDKSLRGPPGQGPIAPEELVKGGEESDFQPLDEPFNEYLIMDKDPLVIRIKAVATRIRFYPQKFNAFGDPVVNVDSQVVMSPPRKARPHDLTT